RKGGLSYDLPLDGRVEGELLSARADTILGQDGMVRITMTKGSKEPAMLAIRQPEWAKGLEARGKGIGQLMPLEQGYRGIERVWSAGDVVEIEYAMDLRAKP